MNMVTIATYDDPKAAEPLQTRFEKAGIHAEICDESKFEWFWFVSKPVAGIRLKVHKKDFERARRLLKEWDAGEHVLREAVRCPQCGCSRVEYPQITRKFFLPNLVSVASAMGIFEKEFYCQECEYTWPKDAVTHPPRKHSAPVYFIEGARPMSTSTTRLAPEERAP